MWEKLINRFKEPSTYAGLGGAAMLYGLSMDQFDIYVTAISGIFLFLSVVLKEVRRD